MDHKFKIIQGLVSDSVIFVLTIIISLAVIPIYLSFITIEEYGIYIAVQGIIAVVSLADIGFSVYTEKKLSNSDFFHSDSLISYLHSAQIFQYILGIFLLGLGYIIYLNVGSILNISSQYAILTKELFLFAWYSVVVGVWFGLNHAIVRSRHELKYMNILVFSKFLIINILTIVFLIMGFDLVWFGIAILIATVIINIILAFKVYNKYKIKLFIPYQFNMQYIKDGWNYIKQFQILRIGQVSKTALFTVLLTNYGGQQIVAQYNITSKIPQLIPGFISKVIMNFFPSISASFEKNEKDTLRVLYEKIFKLGIFTILFCFYALYSLNKLFIEMWVGIDKFIGFEIFIFILLNFVVMTLISFTGIIIQASGKFKKMPLLSFVELIVFIILSYILFKYMGLIGFFIGYLLSTLIGLSYSLYLVNNILNVNLGTWVIQGMKNFLILFILMISSDIAINLIIENSLFKFIILFVLYLLYFVFTSGGYTKIDLLRFFVEYYKSSKKRIYIAFKVHLKMGGGIIMSRTACLGNNVIDKLFSKNKININFPKNRIDKIIENNTNNISVFQLRKVFNRYDILTNSIYMQNNKFIDDTLTPEYIFFDSFSELTDQKFTHIKDKYSFYCNYGDINPNSIYFDENIKSNGLIDLDMLQDMYHDVFTKINNTYGEVPIIFMHFPSTLESREVFKNRALIIKEIIETLSSKIENLYSISIDDSYVSCPNDGTQEYKTFPYHYSNNVYDEFTKEIKKLKMGL